jgi:ABC-type glycerol-3-phosphate transport system substrate-binding protein
VVLKFTNRKGRLAAVAAVASLVLGATSFATVAVAAPKKTEVSFLTFTSPALTKSFWQAQAKAIEKANPDISIKVLFTPTLDRHGYAKQLLASGQLPDVVWDVPLTDFVKAGALLPFPKSYYSKINVPSDFGAVNGKQYSLSSGAFMMNNMFYNIEAFAKAGVSVPKTFADLKAAGPKLKAAGYTPILMNAADLWADEYLLDGFVASDVLAKSPNWLKLRKGGIVKFDSPNFRSAVQKFVDIIDADMINSDVMSLDWGKAVTAWSSGKYAMWPMGGWGGGAGYKTNGFTAGLFPIPGNNQVVAVSPGPSIYVSSSTKVKNAALKVALGLANSKGYAESVMINDGQLSVIKGGIKPPKGTTKATLAAIKFASSKNVKKVWPFPTTSSGDDAPPSGWVGEYQNAIQGLLTGKTSVDAFVKTLDAKWDSLSK